MGVGTRGPQEHRGGVPCPKFRPGQASSIITHTTLVGWLGGPRWLNNLN